MGCEQWWCVKHDLFKKNYCTEWSENKNTDNCFKFQISSLPLEEEEKEENEKR